MCIGLYSLAMDSPGVQWIRLLGIGLSYWILDCPVYWIAQCALESLIGHWIALLYIGLHCVLESPTVY